MSGGKNLLKVTFVSAFIILCLATVTRADTYLFHLKGIEIAKGIDIGPVRYGMTTTGKVFSPEGEEVGFWLLRIHFKNREDIEVCDGTNDIVWFKLEISFTGGYFAGHRLVLGMRDWRSRIEDDVFWSFYTEPCSIGGFDCHCPPVSEPETCSGDFSNLALIPNIHLKKWFGSTLPVTEAWVQDGWLCHQYPFIPRVDGDLVIGF
jgi:hypothetical protein